ncbi:alpha/beta hydrolase [Evansella halocellulosilytica]|uniref:alpha/beta hydrolase n=1 Tax=Evansella halocellulosilytica TaxID=2011013 RepID=UPI000BB99677|nr:alpha/beta hydrolase [Evansella halocellulosilytica]
MKSSVKHGNSSIHTFITAIILAANCISILFGIIYIWINPSYGMWNVLGVILLLTLLSNVTVTLYKSKHRWLDYFYLSVTIIAMFVIPIMNRQASNDLLNVTSRSGVSIFSLFILLVLGAIVSYKKLSYMREAKATNDEDDSPPLNHTQTVLKKMLTVFLLITLGLGVYFAFALLTGSSVNLLEVVLPQYALFFSVIFLTIAIFIIKISLHKKTAFYHYLIGIVGGILMVTYCLPLITTLFAVDDVESNYTDAFGGNSNQNDVLSIPFSLPNYFFGTGTNNYRLKQDTLFYEGEYGVDKGIKLYFDAYTPPDNKENLPGNNSVLIRIHGGGWTAGDKGSSNNAQVNKHFASLGYVVFDVQHGLSHEEKFFKYLNVPDHLVAGFTIDDMVRHIGIFTDYLVENHEDYGANLDSVFVSGASAGGQLANSVGLGLVSGEYPYLNPNLTIKGIISIYPANGLAPVIGISGPEELTDPALLVTEESPPALIYQGTHDRIVDKANAIMFDKAYDEKGDSQAALVLLPFAGHASNSYYPGYYNQVFIYYMERFMQQFQ